MIDGAAGVGKTALALRFSHEAASRFPDGQLYLNLRGFDPRQAPLPTHDALGHLLRGLGAEPQLIPPDAEDQAGMYRTLTSGKRMLIVLDNAATARQVRPLLPGSESCLTLLTSRNRLGGLVSIDGAHQITLGMLSREEAVALLARIAGISRVDAEPDAAADVCRLCGYLPLALRIAAARIAARPHLRLHELAGELAPAAARLDMASDDELTSVRGVFSWSYRVIPPRAGHFFRLLSLHAGSDISAPCAAALTGTGTAGAQRLLQALADAHLLEETGNDRYCTHDLLRLYAAERASHEPARQRADAVQRVLAWYLYTAAAGSRILAPRKPFPLVALPPGVTPLHFPGQSQALVWFEAERANIVAATRQAADSQHHDIAWQLPAVSWDFFYRRRHLADWITISTIGLASARRIGDRHGEAWSLHSLGDAVRDSGRPDEAIGHHRRALAIRREIGDRQGEGWTLGNLGLCYEDQRHFTRALTCYRQAAAAERDAGDSWGLGVSLTNIGEASQNLGRFEEGLAACQEALPLHRQIGDQHSEAWTMNNLASIYKHLHRWHDAIDHCHQALAIQRDIDDRWGQSRTLSNLAIIHEATRQYTQAIDSYQQALTLQRGLGDRHGQTTTLSHLARLYEKTGQLSATREYPRQAEEIDAETDKP